MSDVTMKWRGKDKLAAKLRKLAPEADKALGEVNGKTADEMVGLARSFAPRRTGALAESIVATPPGQLPPAYSQGAGQSGTWMVSAGNEGVRYAHLPEFGTAGHLQGGQFAGSEHPGTKAQPYFFPAYRLIRKKHRGRASRALNSSVKKVVGK